MKVKVKVKVKEEERRWSAVAPPSPPLRASVVERCFGLAWLGSLGVVVVHQTQGLTLGQWWAGIDR